MLARAIFHTRDTFVSDSEDIRRALRATVPGHADSDPADGMGLA